MYKGKNQFSMKCAHRTTTDNDSDDDVWSPIGKFTVGVENIIQIQILKLGFGSFPTTSSA